MQYFLELEICFFSLFVSGVFCTNYLRIFLHSFFYLGNFYAVDPIFTGFANYILTIDVFQLQIVLLRILLLIFFALLLFLLFLSFFFLLIMGKFFLQFLSFFAATFANQSSLLALRAQQIENIPIKHSVNLTSLAKALKKIIFSTIFSPRVEVFILLQITNANFLACLDGSSWCNF